MLRKAVCIFMGVVTGTTSNTVLESPPPLNLSLVSDDSFQARPPPRVWLIITLCGSIVILNGFLWLASTRKYKRQPPLHGDTPMVSPVPVNIQEQRRTMPASRAEYLMRP